MIERYTTQEMGALFNDVNRMATWLDVEVAVVRALANSGVIDSVDAYIVEATRPTID